MSSLNVAECVWDGESGSMLHVLAKENKDFTLNLVTPVMCLDWAMGFPDTWSNIPSISVRYFWMSLTQQSVDGIKYVALLNVGQSTEGLSRMKGRPSPE